MAQLLQTVLGGGLEVCPLFCTHVNLFQRSLDMHGNRQSQFTGKERKSVDGFVVLILNMLQ